MTDNRSPLRVAQLVETLTMGGAENLAVQIANARAAAGDRSYLYVMQGPGPLSGRIDPAVSVRYFHYQRESVRHPLTFLRSLHRGERVLAGQLTADGVQVLQTHLPGANFWGLLLAWRRRTHVVATVHNNREFDYGDADHPVRRRLRRLAYRSILRRCDAVVAVSADVARSLLTEVGMRREQVRRLAVVPNGVPLPEPLPLPRRRELRERFGCGPDDVLVLAAGRHSEQKNFRCLVEAAPALLAQAPRCRVVIAGDGPLRTRHQAHAARLGVEGAVEFPGNLADLDAVMQAADLFVLPSLWEGLPLVLLEAMAAGLPVVGSRIPGIADVVEEGRQGLLVPPDDPAALAAALADLAADPERRRAMGAAGRALVERDYSFTRVAADLEQLYRRIVAA